MELIGQIEQLENKLKESTSLSKSQMLQALYEDLKIINAQTIAWEILYAKQRAFDYRDKLSKQLAQVLSGPTARARVGPLRTKDGGQTDDIEET